MVVAWLFKPDVVATFFLALARNIYSVFAMCISYWVKETQLESFDYSKTYRK